MIWTVWRSTNWPPSRPAPTAWTPAGCAALAAGVMSWQARDGGLVRSPQFKQVAESFLHLGLQRRRQYAKFAPQRRSCDGHQAMQLKRR